MAQTTEQPPPTTIVVDGEEIDVDSLPWLRRPRRLRRQLVGTLLLIAFISVMLIGGLNFVAGRQLLDDGTKEQLTAVGEARARSIERGIDRILGQVAVASADLAVVGALERLDEAFAELESEELDANELAELDGAYQADVVEPLAEIGIDVTVEEARPGSEAGRYLQYHYTLGIEPEARRQVADAGDGSTYSEVHADVHAELVAIAEALGFGDVLLVSAESEDIVYSLDKRIDVGTNLTTGPYRDTPLAEGVLQRLSRTRIGESVIIDQGIHIPGGGRPVVYVASTIRRDTEVVGALVAEIPIEALNAVTTANGEWEAVGLGTGESYVVNAEQLLRSESRTWIEDPDRYLDRTDEELVDLIVAFDSPVGIQTVDTKPVREAREGRTFQGTARDYLGQRTFAYSTPIDSAGVGWVMVADVPLGDARDPLFDFARNIGLVLLIVLPAAGLLGIWLAGRITRPIPPVVRAAQAVASGERDLDLPDLGRDEFGDLARRLGEMAGALKQREAELEREYERHRELLLSVLPPRILDDDGTGVGTGEEVTVATVVSVRVEVTGEESEAEAADLLTRLLEQAESSASAHGLDRISAAADRYLFLAGATRTTDGADEALEFAQDLVASLSALVEEEDVTAHVGLSTGPVATGVLKQGGLVFGAWGEPVRRAMAIAALSGADEILVDATTVAVAAMDRWRLEAAPDVFALDGEPMDLMLLVSSRATVRDA